MSLRGGCDEALYKNLVLLLSICYDLQKKPKAKVNNSSYLAIVLSNVDLASLWNVIIIEVGGRVSLL